MTTEPTAPHTHTHIHGAPLHPHAETTPWLSIVLPAHNESENIQAVTLSFAQAASTLQVPCEILVVDDCSTDDTGDRARSCSPLLPPNISLRILRRDHQGGYGNALTTGFNNAQGTWVFFCDSDGQFDSNDLPLFLQPLFSKNPPDAVVGFRSPRSDTWPRILLGRAWSSLTRSLLNIRIKDINCAFKVIHRDHLRAMNLSSRGALINAELLHKARRANLRILQTPVQHLPRLRGEPSGAHPLVITRALSELLSYRINSLRDHLP